MPGADDRAESILLLMGAHRALLTGAGISAQPPASLPLGIEFEAMLQQSCFEAAAAIAPGAIDKRSLEVVGRVRRNVFARIAACAGAGVVDDLMRCFRVLVPSEAHMLAAVHTVWGALHVTLNFDDGVEKAYALLSGQEQLPPTTPGAFHRALDAWRRVVRPSGPLSVVASRFSKADFGHRPLLVKLRGSAEEGWHPNLIPRGLTRDLGGRGLTEEQVSALKAASEARHLTIAGVSGADTDYRTVLLPMLRPGRFSWSSASLDPEIIDLVRRIDPSQPTLRPAVEGLRSALPRAAGLLAWPRTAARQFGFGHELAAWRARLPDHAAAETYAWLLRESGVHEQANAVLGALAASGAILHGVPAGPSAR